MTTPTFDQRRAFIIDMLEDARSVRESEGVNDPALDDQYERVVTRGDFSHFGLGRPASPTGRVMVPGGQQGFKPEVVNRTENGAMVGERPGKGGAGRYGTHKRTGGVRGDGPSPAQREYLTDLIAKISGLDAEAGRLVQQRYDDEGPELTGGRGGTASVLIDDLKKILKVCRDNAAAASRTAQAGQGRPAAPVAGKYPPLPEVPAGYYAVRTDKVRFYRVKHHKNGKTYLNIQASEEWYPVDFRSYREILGAIALDPEAAGKLYADELGSCYLCNRPLTDEESRRFGTGPDCGGRR